MVRNLSRRTFIKLLGVSSAVACLAACAPKAPTVAPATAAPAAEPTKPKATPQPAAKEPITIQVWNHQSVEDPNRKNSEKRFAESFQPKWPHVSLQWEQISGGEMVTKLRTAAVAGTPPDIGWMGDYIFEFAQNKWVFPAPDDFQARVLQECFETAWKPGMYQGKLYGSPSWYALGPGYVMINKGLAEEAGLDLKNPPTDWAGLTAWGQKAAKWEGESMVRLGLGHGIFTGATPAGQYALWASKVWSAGGELFDEGLTKALFNSEAGIEAIKIARTILKEAKACSAGFIPDNEAMYTNKGVMWVANTSWGAWLHLTVLKQDEKGAIPKELLPVIKYHYIPLPTIKDSVAVAGTSYWSVMTPKPERQVVAWALLEDWYNQYQQATEPVGAGNYIPWFKGQLEIEPWKSDQQWQVALKAAAKSRFLPLSPKANELRNAISNELWEAIVKDKDPKQAIQDAAAAAEKILKD